MSTFNSLGSNYTWTTAWRSLVGAGSDAALRAELARRYGGRIVLCDKGREALALGLQALWLPEGSAVAMTGYTCYAVYQAVTSVGLVPVFLDLAPGEFNFLSHQLETAHEKNPEIRAVIIQNTLGLPTDIAKIEKYARRHKLAIVEDLAHSAGGTYPDGRATGSIGDIVMLSFGRDKIIDAVTGGALVVRDQNIPLPHIAELPRTSLAGRIRQHLYPLLTLKIRLTYDIGLGRLLHASLRTLGLMRASVDGGTLALHALPNFSASYAGEQLENIDNHIGYRLIICAIYLKQLPADLLPTNLRKHLVGATGLRFPILVPERESLFEVLERHGYHLRDTWYDAVVAPMRFQPLTSYAPGSCPEAERIASQMINLPTHRGVSPIIATEICKIITVWHASQLAQ